MEHTTDELLCFHLLFDVISAYTCHFLDKDASQLDIFCDLLARLAV